jgi:hypothetical protein
MPTKKSEKLSGIQRAVKLAGGQVELGQMIDVTQQNISKWCISGYAPIDRAIQISQLFDIPARQLVSPKIQSIFAPKKRA